MNRVWNKRRAGVRMDRAIRKGMKAIGADPFTLVPLPDGLVLISMEVYDSLERLARFDDAAPVDLSPLDYAVLRRLA